MQRCHPDARYELIEGEIVIEMPNPPHVYASKRVNRWLRSLFGEDYVREGHPIHLREEDDPKNDLLPDCLVTTGTDEDYVARHPDPADILIAVEVSDSSIKRDQTEKWLLYARSGIPEYWVLNLPDRRLFIYRQPASQG